MKDFGITQQKKISRKEKIKKTNIIFVIILGICFIFFSIFANLSNILFSKNKIDVFRKDINQLAFSFRTIDKNVSNFLLTIEDITNVYIQ
jgi:capsule polysaccharide export protein KpsE/RkpR